MKRLVFIIMISLAALTMQAQRCAVLEFRARVGISQADVDGISAIFITYFQPAGYTMVERTQIDKVIEEQGFQRSNMTQSQMVRVGQILNVSKIVVGDINVVMGQYNVDCRVLNVETGTIAATEGATFATSSYRSSMQNVAQKLAAKIAIKSGPSVTAPTSPSPTIPKKRTSVEILYGYLKIFPNELGTFSSEPTSVIGQINAQAQHGYNNWRIPTNEELSLLRANNYLGNGDYMTRENRRGIVLLVTDGKDVKTLQAEELERQEQERIKKEEQERIKKEEQERVKRIMKETEERIEKEQEELKAAEERVRQERLEYLNTQGLVDLGLPSGTLWKKKNEGGGFYTKEQVLNKFRNSLPAIEQIEELKDKCRWYWTGDGYIVEGPNGNSITLPAAGYRSCDGGVYNGEGYDGYYWYKSNDSVENFHFYFGHKASTYHDPCGCSVRLVQKKD